MSEHPPNEGISLWNRYVEAHNIAKTAQIAFFNGVWDKADMVRAGLDSPTERSAALRIAKWLLIEERKKLLDGLIALVAAGSMDEPSPRGVILSLPRDWLLANIEESIESQLQHFDSFDYWQILGFCADVDKDLALRLARRAAGHSDPDIKEAGEDYTRRLSPQH